MCIYGPNIVVSTFFLLMFSIVSQPVVTCAFHLRRKGSRYSEKDAAVVVRQMLKVAAECHLRGLVHRDMKPEVCSTTLTWLTCKLPL